MSETVERRALPDAYHDPDVGAKRTVMAMVGVMLLFLVAMFAWAAYAELDVAVNANGTVIPPSRLQEVQSLEGGIVKEMRVAAGQAVKKGDVIAQLDTAQYESELGETQQNRYAALAGRARVEALLQGTAPRFDPKLAKEAPALVEKETQLWRDALREYQSGVTAAREGVARRRGELAEAEARVPALQASVKLAEEAFAIEERLFKEGAGARADYLAAQQRLLAQRNELQAIRDSLPRLRAGLAEAQASAGEIESRSRAQWGGQRTEFETKAAALGSTLAGREDRVARREIVSPVDGVVNRVLVPTLGGVVAPGKPLVEIVPADARLMLGVRVKPSDIGFIHPGQEANVRVLAYDAATHGQMRAKVEVVGADAVVNERGEAYFEVQLSADRDQLKLHGKPLPVTAGMPVDAGILTGRRSVLQYLLKPVLRGLQSSLRER